MEMASIPLLNQQDYSYFNTFLQELNGTTEMCPIKRQKLDESDCESNPFNEFLDTIDFLDDPEIPSSKFEIPRSNFETRASKMADSEQGRVRKSRNQTSPATHGGATAADDGSFNKSGGGAHRRLWVKERSKGWWEYYDSDECTDSEFRKAFRMSKSTFSSICDELESAVTKKDTMLRTAIPVRQRIAVCVYRLATGDPLRTVSSLFGLGISTCHKLVLEVCVAIKTVLMPKYLQWPNDRRLNEIKSEFGSVSGIPNVGGSIYTTHISIIAPKTNPEAYFNKKHTDRNQKPSYSTTVQGVVDSRGVFTDICIGYPGSFSNDEILKKSALSKRFDYEAEKNTWIVGQTGRQDWILVPYAHKNLTWSQHVFNEKISEVQKISKDAFMRLKGRWGFLQKRTEVKLQELPMVLGACGVLHNICEINNEEMEEDLRFDLFDDEMVVESSRGKSVNSLQARDAIAHNLLHRGDN